ncbi:MAG: hypothetical protein JO369_00880 [Paucibacter sp.]|nr:hypothetical protein [Roseateles sp.]
MVDKNLSESSWKTFAKSRDIKDAALLKALAELAKAEKSGSAAWLDALAAAEKQIEALRKLHKADKEILAQFKQMDAAIASERKAANRLVEQEAEETEEEAGPAVLTTKLVPLLRSVRKGEPCQALIAVGAKKAAVMLSRRPLTASAHKPLKEYLADSGTPKFIPAACLFEANAVTFVVEAQASGLAKKIKAALLKQTEQRVKVRVRGEAPDDIDDDGDEDDGADVSGEGDEPPSAAAQSAQPAASDVEALRREFKARLAPLVPRIKTLTEGGWSAGRTTTAEIGDAAALLTSNPAKALEQLDAIAKRVRAAEVEAQRAQSLALSEQLKAGMHKLLEVEPPDLALLRRAIEHELQRANALAKDIKAATEDGVPIAPPPAKVGFTANTDAGASEWTEPVCRAAFRKYGWFTFKDLRKSKTPVELPGVVTQTVITDAVMWKLYQYRRHYVDGLIARLHADHPRAGLLFKSGGSEDIESDLDITVASPNSGVDVVAMKAFNDQVKADFGRPPGRVFDTNLYARDYNAIKDNLSAPGAAGTTPDTNIAEPTGAMAKMAGIDQDVATLMKQRRFLGEETYTTMWQALRAAAPESEQDLIQERFEEAEDVYLLTAREKVEAIVKTVQDKLDSLGADERTVERAAFAHEQAEFRRLVTAAETARGVALTDALKGLQNHLPEFLDVLEENFPDEVMETTDAMYAKTMTALREDQAKVRQLEAHLAEAHEGPQCEELHKGVAHAAWLAQAPAGINALKARVKQAQFTNIVFANEAYVSQGAITHIVSGAQAATEEEKREVLERIQPAELLQSANEQMADFYKDMKHLEREANAAAIGQAQRRKHGEAFVHASKYLSRMLDAAAMLQDKYAADADAMAILTGKAFDLCVRAKVEGPRQLQAEIDKKLVSLRKSSTVPGDAKAEVAFADVQTLFGVATIDALRKLITAFGIDFNDRVRRLKDFRAAQVVDDQTQREYFRPAR